MPSHVNLGQPGELYAFFFIFHGNVWLRTAHAEISQPSESAFRPLDTMCGRYTLNQTPKSVALRFEAAETIFEFPPRFNIAPSQAVPVITQNAFGDGLRVLEGMRWGLVPSWAKDTNLGAKMINARVETLLEKPAYKRLLARKRCLIPADGLYEWKTEGKTKLPFHIRFRDRHLFAFAGLWDEWEAPDGSPLRSCTIVTGAPNPLVAGIHDRMAVILRPEDETVWLDNSVDTMTAFRCLRTYPDTELEAVPVDKRVGNVVFDSPDLLAPAPIAPAPDQLNLL